MKSSRIPAAALAAVATLALLTGCAGAGPSGGDTDTIKIGASIPLTGPLSSFGPVLQDGYQAAVDEVNAAGGVSVDGAQREVELVVLDNESDPTKAADQSRTLVLEDGVAGLLGSVSPGLTIPASNIADLEKVPLVSSLTPIRAWLAGNPDGWQFAWNLFFDEAQQTQVPFLTADLTETNKKVALFTSTEEDGVAMGGIWEQSAPDAGYEIVSHAEFPVGTTDYSEYINAAKTAGAEVVITQMIPPDAFALWKQMKALAFVPKVAFCEKCSAQGAFSAELGPLAEGTSVSYLGAPADSAEAAALTEEFGQSYGQTVDLTSVMATYSAAKILLDAITQADSTDGAAINAAIASLSGEYPIGDVQFAEDHSYAIPAVGLQWQSGAQVQVYPVDGNALIAPVTGLE
jgi:branched-chain amino acid transport system substrate-binding protein